jgi:energy-coupling factor transporter ATP-binding protein EcfA2
VGRASIELEAAEPHGEPDRGGVPTRRRGRLRPGELAEAAILADVAVGLILVGWLLPLGTVLHAASVTPLAALTVRHRLRAMVVATLAGAAVAFLVGGVALATNVGTAGALGFAVGIAARRGWGMLRTLVLAVFTTGTALIGISLGLLFAFSHLRQLTLAQIRLGWQGSARVIRALGLPSVAHWGDVAVNWIIAHWWLAIPAGELVAIVAAAVVARALAVPALRRLTQATGPSSEPAPAPSEAPPGPIPVELRGVSYRYPRSGAAALARRPALLITDEATSMLDATGRAELTGLLRRLARSQGVTVLHITHRRQEAEGADLVVELSGGRVVCAASDCPPAEPISAVPTPTRSRRGAPLARLAGVGFVYARRSPWEHRALADVDLEVEEGEGLVVIGHNGSGKSTLAWILAGLLSPTEGEATLEDRPLHECVGRVGVAFQHARLQLFRPTVFGDVAFGADLDDEMVASALREVGLDPDEMTERRIDALSGGQQRRVALAGLLVRKPRLLVLDEPLAGLDEESRTTLLGVLAQLRDHHGVATVVVSHDLEAAPGLADRLVVLDRGQLVTDGVVCESLVEARARTGGGA